MAEQERSRGGSARLAGPPSVEEVAERAARLGITPERVLEQYGRIAFTSLRDIVDWDDKGMTLKSDADTAAIIEIVTGASTGKPYRIKLHDKKAVLDALGRAIGVFPQRAPAPNQDDTIEIDAQSAREKLIAELDRLAAEQEQAGSAPEPQR